MRSGVQSCGMVCSSILERNRSTTENGTSSLELLHIVREISAIPQHIRPSNKQSNPRTTRNCLVTFCFTWLLCPASLARRQVTYTRLDCLIKDTPGRVGS